MTIDNKKTLDLFRQYISFDHEDNFSWRASKSAGQRCLKSILESDLIRLEDDFHNQDLVEHFIITRASGGYKNRHTHLINLTGGVGAACHVLPYVVSEYRPVKRRSNLVGAGYFGYEDDVNLALGLTKLIHGFYKKGRAYIDQMILTDERMCSHILKHGGSYKHGYQQRFFESFLTQTSELLWNIRDVRQNQARHFGRSFVPPVILEMKFKEAEQAALPPLYLKSLCGSRDYKPFLSLDVASLHKVEKRPAPRVKSPA